MGGRRRHGRETTKAPSCDAVVVRSAPFKFQTLTARFNAGTAPHSHRSSCLEWEGPSLISFLGQLFRMDRNRRRPSADIHYSPPIVQTFKLNDPAAAAEVTAGGHGTHAPDAVLEGRRRAFRRRPPDAPHQTSTLRNLSYTPCTDGPAVLESSLIVPLSFCCRSHDGPKFFPFVITRRSSRGGAGRHQQWSLW